MHAQDEQQHDPRACMKPNVIHVIWNEHTLGYINPRLPILLGVLHASVLRGAIIDFGPIVLSSVDTSRRTLRPATAQDFDAYRCVLPPNFQQAADAQLKDILDAIDAAMKVGIH